MGRGRVAGEEEEEDTAGMPSICLLLLLLLATAYDANALRCTLYSASQLLSFLFAVRYEDLVLAMVTFDALLLESLKIISKADEYFDPVEKKRG